MPNLSPIDFTKKDAQDILRDALEFIPSITDKWTDFSDEDFGVVMLSLMSRMAASIGFAVDRQANEAFLSRALERKNVLAHAREKGYDPGHYVSSKVVVRFSRSSSGGALQIPNDTVVVSTVGNQPVQFIPDQSASIEAGETYVDVPCTQGISLTDVSVSVGYSNIKIDLPHKDVAPNTIKVSVAGNLWERKKNLIDSISSDQHYTVSTDAEYITSVYFGDGIYGAIPGSGQSIQVTYYRSKGIDGNVGSNTITVLRDSTLSSAGVSVTNPSPAIGGSGPEGIEVIRRKAPAFLASIGGAVSQKGYISTVEGIEGVARANVWGERHINPPPATPNKKYSNFVMISVAPPFDSNGNVAFPSQLLKDKVISEVETQRDSLGLVVTRHAMIDPSYVDVVITARVKSDDNFSSASVKKNIVEKLKSYFSLENRTFNETIHYSRLMQLISGGLTEFTFDGVDYIELLKVSSLVRLVGDKEGPFEFTEGVNDTLNFSIDGEDFEVVFAPDIIDSVVNVGSNVNGVRKFTFSKEEVAVAINNKVMDRVIHSVVNVDTDTMVPVMEERLAFTRMFDDRVYLKSRKKDGTGSVTIGDGNANGVLGFTEDEEVVGTTNENISLWLNEFPVPNIGDSDSNIVVS